MPRLFSRKISSRKAITLIAVLAISVASYVVATTTGFNIMSGDLKTLKLVNNIQGGAWADTITANAGDRVALRVYYHCATDDPAWTTIRAYGTVVRIDFPTAQQTTIVPTARLSANNLAQISDTGTITVSSSQKLIFDGAAHWYEGGNDHGMIAVAINGGSAQVSLGDAECDPLNPPCYSKAGYVVFAATVSSIFPAPTVDLKVNGSDGPLNLAYNNPATLSWSSTNATTCYAGTDWLGTKATSGSESTGNLTSSKTYTISCTGPGGTSSTDTVVVNVQAPAPTVDLKINGQDGTVNVTYNTSAALSWTSTNATTCYAGTDWLGTKATSGSESTGNLTSSKTYTIYCTGPGGTSSTDTVGANVQSLPPTVNLKANGSEGPITINYNTSAVLTWTTTNNPTSCTATCIAGSCGNWLSQTPSVSGGSWSTENLTAASRTYGISCSNPSGSNQDSVLVQVPYCLSVPPALPI